uniref:Uncharacterized protein n=1 Tax=viral metagenome TaxID=1070528 RepID=A0A6C0K4R2_9ZZZZ
MWIPNLNLIFIHIPKNAGTSMEHALLKIGMPERYIIDGVISDAIRKNELLWTMIMYCIVHDIDNYRYFAPYIRDYHQIYTDFGEIINKSSKKPCIMTIIRHPRQRAISLYKFTHSYKFMSFSYFIEKILLTNKIPELSNTQYSMLCDYNGNLDNDIVILRHENLDSDWETFCQKNNIPFVRLGRENTSVSISIVADFAFLEPSIIERFDAHYAIDYQSFYP